MPLSSLFAQVVVSIAWKSTKGSELEKGISFHLVPEAPLYVRIVRGYLENVISLIKSKDTVPKVVLESDVLSARRMVGILKLVKVKELKTFPRATWQTYNVV